MFTAIARTVKRAAIRQSSDEKILLVLITLTRFIISGYATLPLIRQPSADTLPGSQKVFSSTFLLIITAPTVFLIYQ